MKTFLHQGWDSGAAKASTLDENSISVRCGIEGCNSRVVGDTRCQDHSGDPDYSWAESAWGTVSYYVKEGATTK